MEIIACATTLLLLVSCASASRLRPPVLPLIVRNPYLSTWLTHARDPPWQAWPMFYTGEAIGLSIMASITAQSTVYPLLGRPQDSLRDTDASYAMSYPEYLGSQYDASATNLSYTLRSHEHSGMSANITLSFLSPITPTSTLRQAIPAAYLHITVEANCGVDIYIDVNGQWVSGARDATIEWQLDRSLDYGNGSKSWTVHRQQELLFTEINDRAEWGSLWFTGPSDTTHACGESAHTRADFASNGTLSNHTDRHYRAIMRDEPVFAFAKRFPAVHNTSSWSDSVLFTIAHVQDHIVQFASSDGLQEQQPLWQSYFGNTTELVNYHYKDFSTASRLASAFSSQVNEDAYEYSGSEYADIVALSARQVMGATSFSGSPIRPLLFLKEISSNGNSQTVDIIFPAAPFFFYSNPRWLLYLLEPLLDHQLSGQYPNNYSMHDLGTHFPNMTGHPDGRDEYMPVEESGDMIIIALALTNAMRRTESSDSSGAAKSKQSRPGIFTLTVDDTDGRLDRETLGEHSNDHAWVTRAWPLWSKWTEYLIRYSLEPQNQLCTDDFAGELALQTNLALKGIVGIKAMSELAQLIGEQDEHRYYQNISETYISRWLEYAISRDGQRAKLAYDWHGSWTTLYSLYANSLLCFQQQSTIPDSAAQTEAQVPLMEQHQESKSRSFLPHDLYQNQSAWYQVAMQKYGLPLDSRHLYAKSDWELQAASVASPQTRQQIIERLALWVNETKTDRPFSDLYITEGDGGFPGPNFFARPVVGSHFAPLVLERACDGHGADPYKSEWP